MNHSGSRKIEGKINQANSGCRSRIIQITSATIVLLATLLATTAQAQTDADFSAYCREKFPGSIYESRNQSWGTEHACNQGGTRQGIDLAEACRKTAGSPGHKVSGTRVICDGTGVDPAAAVNRYAGSLDLSAYCRANFPNSIPELRYESGGAAHYCRQTGGTGGLTLQRIDLAAACKAQRNASSFRIAGAQVMCLNAASGTLAQDEREGGGGGGGGGGGDTPTKRSEKDPQPAKTKITPADIRQLLNREFPPLEAKDIVDAGGSGELYGKGVKFTNLQNCGNGDPAFMLLGLAAVQKSISDPKGLNGRGWDHMGVSVVCPGLTGGKIVNFQTVCKNWGGKPNWTVKARASGLPICWKNDGSFERQPEHGGGLDSHFALSGMTLSNVCSRDHEKQNKGKLSAKGLVALVKYKIKETKVECFYLKRCQLLETLGLGTSCERPASKDPNKISGTDGDDQLDATSGKDVFSGGKGRDTFSFNYDSFGPNDPVTTLNSGDRITDYELGERITIKSTVLSKTQVNVAHDSATDETRIEIDLPDAIDRFDGRPDRTIILKGNIQGEVKVEPNCCGIRETYITINADGS